MCGSYWLCWPGRHGLGCSRLGLSCSAMCVVCVEGSPMLLVLYRRRVKGERERRVHLYPTGLWAVTMRYITEVQYHSPPSANVVGCLHHGGHTQCLPAHHMEHHGALNRVREYGQQLELYTRMPTSCGACNITHCEQFSSVYSGRAFIKARLHALPTTHKPLFS